MNRTALACTTIATLGLLGAAWLTAGPLTPPAGAPAPTYKTLQEVEPRTPISGPFTITTSGSYYLTGNITGVAAQDVINIQAVNVDLDLNGYTISGGRTGIIINAGGTTGNIVIRNGTIQNVSGSGIFSNPVFFGGNSPPTTVRNVTLNNITDSGILLGARAIIDRVKLAAAPTSTTSSGFTLGPSAKVNDSSIDTVALRGIDASSEAQIDAVYVFNAGTDGVRVGSASRVTNSTVSSPGGNAFVLGQYASILSSTAFNPRGNGFVLDVGGTAKDCNATNVFNDAYVVAAGGTVLDSVANTIGGNAFVSNGATFDRCTAFNIALNGFVLNGASVVTNSSVSSTGSNSTLGTITTSGALVLNSGNRIEGNRFVACGFPVFFASGSAGNAAYRNAAIQCNNSFTNSGAASNLIGTIRTNTLPSGPWDNTVQ